MQRKLELELDKQSVMYKTHKADIADQIQRVHSQLAQCLQLKDSCVESRLQKHEIIIDLIEKTNTFKQSEDKDAQEILAKREQIYTLLTEMRKLQETVIAVQNDQLHYTRVLDADKQLNTHRAELILQNLNQALSDASHHLKWLQHRNEQESITQAKIAQITIEEPFTQIEMEQNTQQHAEYAQDYHKRFSELKDENRQLLAKKDVQNRQI